MREFAFHPDDDDDDDCSLKFRIIKRVNDWNSMDEADEKDSAQLSLPEAINSTICIYWNIGHIKIRIIFGSDFLYV